MRTLTTINTSAVEWSVAGNGFCTPGHARTPMPGSRRRLVHAVRTTPARGTMSACGRPRASLSMPLSPPSHSTDHSAPRPGSHHARPLGARSRGLERTSKVAIRLVRLVLRGGRGSAGFADQDRADVPPVPCRGSRQQRPRLSHHVQRREPDPPVPADPLRGEASMIVKTLVGASSCCQIGERPPAPPPIGRPSSVDEPFGQTTCSGHVPTSLKSGLVVTVTDMYIHRTGRLTKNNGVVRGVRLSARQLPRQWQVRRAVAGSRRSRASRSRARRRCQRS